jgi:hypothetical protein
MNEASGLSTIRVSSVLTDGVTTYITIYKRDDFALQRQTASQQGSFGPITFSPHQSSVRKTRFAEPIAPSITPGDSRSVSVLQKSKAPFHSGVDKARLGMGCG